jgi:hypothetical protein
MLSYRKRSARYKKKKKKKKKKMLRDHHYLEKPLSRQLLRGI